MTIENHRGKPREIFDMHVWSWDSFIFSLTYVLLLGILSRRNEDELMMLTVNIPTVILIEGIIISPLRWGV
ncbi:MAG: hypothetical protein HQK55_11125 [Deltaproteobacteria bacterium]|nr:hypothetical protein [Deltaproteobacteria bacterium]